MALINEKSVYTKFLKGNNIILSGLVVEFVELLLDGFLRAFQLLNREIISTISFQVRNTVGDFLKLFLKDCSLSFNTHRYFFKLRVSDDDSIVVARSNSTAKSLTVFGFKIFLRCHQNISRRIELQELCRPLFGQVVRHNKQRFIAKSESL